MRKRGHAASGSGATRNFRTRRQAITIHDIAKEAEVSTATVSRVLNHPDRVSAAVRERVLAVVDRQHYVSDGFGAGLASQRSRLIGLLIPTITNSIYASSTQAIQRVAQHAGYTVLVGVYDYSAQREEELVQKLLERRVDGLILTGEERASRIYDKIRKNGVPFVITWQLTRDASIPCVAFDNEAAAFFAVDHLISLGHRNIGLICGRTDVNDRAQARRNGYLRALDSYGLTSTPLIYERDFEFVHGRSAMHLILQKRQRPTAVFCANDIQAIGAIYESQLSGLRVPDDISIIGFDDIPAAQYTTPQLTTIRVPAEEMGRRAAEILIDAIGGADGTVRIELPTDLIVRQSTMSPRTEVVGSKRGSGRLVKKAERASTQN
jgi:LacI family transcriptional regulator